MSIESSIERLAVAIETLASSLANMKEPEAKVEKPKESKPILADELVEKTEPKPILADELEEPKAEKPKAKAKAKMELVKNDKAEKPKAEAEETSDKIIPHTMEEAQVNLNAFAENYGPTWAIACIKELGVGRISELDDLGRGKLVAMLRKVSQAFDTDPDVSANYSPAGLAKFVAGGM